MVGRKFKLESRFLTLLIVIVIVLPGFQPGAKVSENIILHDETLSIIPKGYYINSVTDEREERKAIAWIMPTVNSSAGTPVDFKGSGFAAINQFVLHSLPQNKSLRSVTMGLKKFAAIETALADGRIEGRISLQLSFNLDIGDGDKTHLVDYNGSATYNRNAGPAQQIEPFLRQALQNGLVYFDSWMNKQAATNIKLATGVKLILSDYAGPNDADTIYYSVKRPLNWDDFQSKISSGKYDAEVFPAIGYDERTEIVNSVVNVHLAVKAFLPKSACWVKDASRTDNALNHEQRHFDIAKLAGEHFKQKLRSETLPVKNFDGFINVDYLDAYREMNALQKQYDDETRHGSNQYEQERWNERIDKELKADGILGKQL